MGERRKRMNIPALEIIAPAWSYLSFLLCLPSFSYVSSVEKVLNAFFFLYMANSQAPRSNGNILVAPPGRLHGCTMCTCVERLHNVLFFSLPFVFLIFSLSDYCWLRDASSAVINSTLVLLFLIPVTHTHTHTQGYTKSTPPCKAEEKNSFLQPVANEPTRVLPCQHGR